MIIHSLVLENLVEIIFGLRPTEIKGVIKAAKERNFLLKICYDYCVMNMKIFIYHPNIFHSYFYLVAGLLTYATQNRLPI